MKMKTISTISVRNLFVNNVVDMCTDEDKIDWSMFEFAFRATMIATFAEEFDVETVDVEKLEAIAFSKEYRDAVTENEDIAELAKILRNACMMALEDERVRLLEEYKTKTNPDPMRMIADAVQNIAEKVKPFLDEEHILELLEQMRDEETKKNGKLVRMDELVKQGDVK